MNIAAETKNVTWFEQARSGQELKQTSRIGKHRPMPKLRKVTAFVSPELLAAAQAHTGAGASETLRRGLESLVHQAFYDRLKALKGTVQFDADLVGLRDDREFHERGEQK